MAEPNWEVHSTISFDYGSKHNTCELPFACQQARALGLESKVVDLQVLDDLLASDLLQSGGEVPEGHYEEQSMKQTVVPFRNAIMLSIACGYAESVGATALLIAAHSGDHAIYPDCREEFMQAMALSMKLGTYQQIELIRPFIHLRKEDIVKRGIELGIDYRDTWSCYKGGDKHCGRCGTCVERKEAFALAGVEDPTDYL